MAAVLPVLEDTQAKRLATVRLTVPTAGKVLRISLLDGGANYGGGGAGSYGADAYGGTDQGFGGGGAASYHGDAGRLNAYGAGGGGYGSYQAQPPSGGYQGQQSYGGQGQPGYNAPNTGYQQSGGGAGNSHYGGSSY